MRGLRDGCRPVVVLLAAVVAGLGPEVATGQGQGVPPRVAGSTAASGFTVTDLEAGAVAELSGINSGAQVVGWGSVGSKNRAWLWNPSGGLRYLTSSRTPSVTSGINDRGQVAGTLYLASGQRVFRWDRRSGMRLMATPRGYRFAGAAGINAAGQVAGSMQRRSDGARRGFMWDPRTGVVRNLHPLRGDTDTVAVGINASGQVAGESSGQRVHAFRWDPRTGLKGLGTLGLDSTVAAINDLGQVAGASWTRAGDWHAFRWDPRDGIRDLGTLGPPLTTASLPWAQATALNNRGQVVGSSWTREGNQHAFRWDPVGGMRDLGTLGGATSQASGLNEAGQVVGSAETRTGAVHAFVWDSRRGMRDLGTALGQDASAAAMVNDGGQVAGSVGFVDHVPEPYYVPRRAVLWSPRVRVAVAAVSQRTRLHLNVDPNLGSGSWLVRVQRRRTDGTWATLVTSYRTWGTAETRTLDLPRGTYRVVVPSQSGYRWAASAEVYLRR